MVTDGTFREVTLESPGFSKINVEAYTSTQFRTTFGCLNLKSTKRHDRNSAFLDVLDPSETKFSQYGNESPTKDLSFEDLTTIENVHRKVGKVQSPNMPAM